MKSKKITARLLALVLAVFLMASVCLSASAAEANQAVVDAKQGVVQIQFWFSDPDKFISEEFWGYGTGFLINENTVVTNEHVISAKTNSDVATEYVVYLYDKYGVVYTPAQVMERVELRIMILRDVYVEATVRKVSTEYDYAILTLNESVHNRSTLALRNSSTLTQTEAVYALGFPYDIEDLTDHSNLTADDVTITTGNVNKVARCTFESYELGPLGYRLREYKDVDCVESSAKIASGNSGGPLVDANGAVVGINVAGTDSRNLAIASDQLIATLDALGIPYELSNPGAGSEEPVATTEPPVSEEPVVTETPTVEDKDDEEEETKKADKDDEEEEEEEEEEDDKKAADEGLSSTTLILIVAAAAVVIIVVVVIAVMSSGKKKAAAAQAAPVSAPPVRPVAPPPANNTGFAPNPTYPLQGAGETTVLTQGAGETTVLARNVNGGTLTRKRTGETVPVNAETFIIGRERKGVNYCISDNSSISRNHVRLNVRGGITYLTDLGAANGTFVNGVKVMPRQEVALKSGDKITLADEDLEYRN